MSPNSRQSAPSERTTLRRNPVRAVHDWAAIEAILDEALVCHVGFAHEGTPSVIPTAFARDGHWLYLHGARNNRMLQAICGSECCICVSLLDGLVLARSAFHHSVNYRSVVIYGTGEAVEAREDKLHAMEMLMKHIVPGRWVEARQPSEREVDITLVVRVPIDECSAKVRTGPPVDDEADMGLDVWAGVLPVSWAWGEAEPDPLQSPSVPTPLYVSEYRRKKTL